MDCAVKQCLSLSKRNCLNLSERYSFINDGVMWANKDRDLTIKTKADDCALAYLPYLVEHEIIIGICTPCAKGRKIDEAKFYNNMQLDGGPHLIEMAAKAKVFNF